MAIPLRLIANPPPGALHLDPTGGLPSPRPTVPPNLRILAMPLLAWLGLLKIGADRPHQEDEFSDNSDQEKLVLKL